MTEVFRNPIYIKNILSYACPLDAKERHKRYSINDAFHEAISVYEEYPNVVPKDRQLGKVIPWLKDAADKNFYKSPHVHKNYIEMLRDYNRSWFSLELVINIFPNARTCSIYWMGYTSNTKSKRLLNKNRLTFRTIDVTDEKIELFCNHVYALKEMIIRDFLSMCEDF